MNLKKKLMFGKKIIIIENFKNIENRLGLKNFKKKLNTYD